jgi:succinate dehydrogenase / fumarate reductase, flavoprotein subunit
MKLDARIPSGPLEEKWYNHKSSIKLVNPSNKRKFDILVVGTGLAGASAAATLAGLGYNVKSFCIQDSARRAHSVAAQGGINAAKNYQNDGDSIWRLFYDTIKGGDFRSREANVYRLAQMSNSIINHCVAQGVPFARDYGGFLANRSFGGAQVSRTFYARGQTGQQLLYGAYGALMKQIDNGKVDLYCHREMLDLVVVDGKARGIVCRNLYNGQIERYAGHAVLLCTGGYSTVYYLSTNAVNSNATAIWRCHRKGALFANPCFTQIHPTCIPTAGEGQSKLTLMSESLRNDGRVWVPRKKGDERQPSQIPEEERDYFLERKYPAFGNLVPRDIASRNAKEVCDEGRGVGPTGYAVYLDFEDAIQRLGQKVIRERYGNLFQLYEEITSDNPYKTPMKIYPAPHYTMGGLWVDYNLMSTVPGLYVLGEANFSDHGANRLGASALMQGLCDGYFVIPFTIGDYLARENLPEVKTDHSEFDTVVGEVQEGIRKLININGSRSAMDIHAELGRVMIKDVGMSRNEKGLNHAVQEIRRLKEEFWQNVKIPTDTESFNKYLEIAGRVSDHLELAELMALDALHRRESCGGHFREESMSEEGEALRDDEQYTYVAAWEYGGPDGQPILHKEELEYEFVELKQRSYK